MRKPEAVVEREILIYLNSLDDAFFYKNDTVGIYDAATGGYRKSPNPYVIRGASDIIGIIKGIVFFFEVKNEVGKESKHQKMFRERWTNLGGNCYVVRSVEDTRSVLEELEIIPHHKISV